MSVDLEVLMLTYAERGDACRHCGAPYSDAENLHCRMCDIVASPDPDVLALIDECVTLRAQLAEANDGVEAGRRAAAAAKELTAALLEIGRVVGSDDEAPVVGVRRVVAQLAEALRPGHGTTIAAALIDQAVTRSGWFIDTLKRGDAADIAPRDVIEFVAGALDFDVETAGEGPAASTEPHPVDWSGTFRGADADPPESFAVLEDAP